MIKPIKRVEGPELLTFHELQPGDTAIEGATGTTLYMVATHPRGTVTKKALISTMMGVTNSVPYITLEKDIKTGRVFCKVNINIEVEK